MNKDLFSGHSALYASFRPTYPEELYRFIFSHTLPRETAWDCGTGNGQVAARLADDFKTVHATDLSKNQLKEAVNKPNILYAVAAAEHTTFPDGYFDLITVGQALHWFDIDKFYDEVRRVGKPGATVALWGYGNVLVSKELDPFISHFYSNVVGPYWDSARRHVETAYEEIPFPFERIEAPMFYIRQHWTLKHLTGYIESWSATQKYILDKKENPIKELEDTLEKKWPHTNALELRFPLFLKLGKIK